MSTPAPSPSPSFRKFDSNQSPSAWHPFNRGITTSLITLVFAEKHPVPAFIYGFFSGSLNLGLHKIQSNVGSGEVGNVLTVFNSFASWCASGAIMSKAFKYIETPDLRWGRGTAIGIAAGVELFTYGFKDTVTRVSENR